MLSGTNVGSVFFDVGFNQKQFNQGVKSSAGFAEKTFGKAFGAIGKMAIAAFSVTAITKFASSAISLASDLEEVQNVVDVTFGQGAKQVNAFAQSSAAAFGLSELSAKQYTGTMGAMLKSMGLVSKQALDMSTDMAALAGDVASFYNLDTDEAFQKIRAGISGETEPLKQLGINMSIVNLEAYAMSQGITKSFAKMTQAEQALLRYNYLMKVTADAQGDFARTSGSWANQTRILKLQWDSFKSSLGGAFIAVLTPVIQMLNIFMAKLVAAGNTFKSFVNFITGNNKKTENSAAGAAAAVSGVGEAADEAGKGAAAGAKKAKGALAAFDELNSLSTDDGSGSGGGEAEMPEMPEIGALEELDTSAIDEYANKLESIKDSFKDFLKEFNLTGPFKNFVETAKNEWGAIKDKAVDSWNSIKDNAAKAWVGITDVIKPLIKPIGTIALEYGSLFIVNFSESIQAGMGILTSTVNGVVSTVKGGIKLLASIAKPILDSLADFFKNNGSKIEGRIREVWGTIETTVRGYVDAIANHIVNVFGGFQTWFEEHYDSIYNTFAGTWEAIWSAVDAIWTGIQTAFEAVFGGMTDFLTQHSDSIRDTLVNTWNIIWQVIEPIWNTITSVVKQVFDGIKSFLNDNMGQIREIFSKAWEAIWTVIKTVLDKINAFWDTWGSTIMADIQGVMNNIKIVFETVWNVIKTVFETTLGAIQGLLDVFIGVISGDWKRAWDGIINIFVSAGKGIVNILIAVGEGLKAIFANAVDTIKNTLSAAWEVIKSKVFSTWKSIKNFIKDIWDGIVGFFSKSWETFSEIGKNIIFGLWDGIKSAWTAVKDGISGIWDSITDGFKSVFSSSAEVEVSGSFNRESMSGGGKGIPKMATGGLVDRPTLALIGEAGKEAVLPLDGDQGWMISLANMISEALGSKLAQMGGNPQQQTESLKLLLDGRVLGELMLDYVLQAADRRGINLAVSTQ